MEKKIQIAIVGTDAATERMKRNVYEAVAFLELFDKFDILRYNSTDELPAFKGSTEPLLVLEGQIKAAGVTPETRRIVNWMTTLLAQQD